jgi:hypothetical protein
MHGTNTWAATTGGNGYGWTGSRPQGMTRLERAQPRQRAVPSAGVAP